MGKIASGKPKTNEHYTPPHIVDTIRELCGGFDLDPASCESANRIVKADRYYTKDMDGLSLPWDGDIIWCNPPYNGIGGVMPWVDKAIECGKTVFMLLNSNTETKYFQKLARSCSSILFIERRIKFYNQDMEIQKNPVSASIIALITDDHDLDSRFRSADLPGEVLWRKL